MHQRSQEKSMSPKLDDLINDSRLERLFSKDANHCALQLWVLQIKSGQSTENRVVYGRLLPYSHSNNSWSFSDNDKFITISQIKAKVTKLTLYIQSNLCTDLLRLLSIGQTISAISEELQLQLPPKLKTQFGTTTLDTKSLAYRPVTYQLNRDAYHNSLSSPHGGAGAFSASITQTNKGELFRLGQFYDIALTGEVVRHLNEDTGMDFGVADTTRFGDLELLVFPSLDNQERRLLEVNWADSPHALIVRFNHAQVPHFNGFQFRLSIQNHGQITYSVLALAEQNKEGLFECIFELDDQLRARVDSTELEIFGFRDGNYQYGILCSRWQIGYIREINFQSHVVGHKASPAKFDWLEKTARSTVSARVEAALTIDRSSLGFNSHVGGREADSWVPANRDITSLFERLHPPKSDGLFCLRWGQGDGDGRLQFVEWFKALLSKHQQHQIVIFDPFFEDAGLGLLLLYAAEKANYIVFRSLPKTIPEDKPQRRKSDKTAQNGINNLLANCEQNHRLLKHIKLRIYGLKEGRLHDRYLLVMGTDGVPIKGFNLSNSFQKAAENYPLLVTPIPSDTLLSVEKYVLSLIQETTVSQAENATINLLFDSSTLAPATSKRYEPLLFLNKANAGDALSSWCNEPALQGLSSKPLKEQMTTLGLLQEESLTLPTKTSGLRNYLDQRVENFDDFNSTWEIIGDVLAHSRTDDDYFRELESEHIFLEFLAHFLKASFNRAYAEMDSNPTVVDTQLFRKTIETLLHSSYNPHHLVHATKYSALTWSEYFAIQYLWRYVPNTLLEIAEAQILEIPMDDQSPNIIRLSLLSQIISEISLSVQFDISEIQRDRLLRSNNALLQWMGLHAIEMQLEKPDGLTAVLSLVTTFTAPNQVRALGWMINHAAANPKKVEIYKSLVTVLHEALPAKISTDELKSLVDSMRGHMNRLAWAEPWLFQDVISPLLENNRANVDDACEIWDQELISMLEPEQQNPSLIFNQAREGQTTNICAFLLANSSLAQQQSSLKLISTILNKQKRIIQQPLASTSNWTRWNNALTISLWILAFSKWGEYYQRQLALSNSKLEQLSQDARKLAMVRPISEWRSKLDSQRYELTEFINQVENLLASANGSEDVI